ncbi:hypothetical protein BJP27_24575 (plasmid) [Pseudomonas oryzihabitans]|nr:hypothetical protein BJP27_23925 [Pseudomonas psychrotolerans]APQ14747.1 hypothetical protein BJP27_24575 [Pseudomonas psychrotolerans]
MQTFRITDGAVVRLLQASHQRAALLAHDWSKGEPELITSGRPAAGDRPSIPSIWRLGVRSVAIEHINALGAVA